ncbi:hypothetical protein, partial [uncultured Dubosiella sp.]
RSVIDYIEEKAYLKFEKKDKEYNRQLEELTQKEKEQNLQLETMTKQLEEKDQRLEEKDRQIDQMISRSVVSAQRLMAMQGLTAEQACDLLGYDEEFRAIVLPYLVS